MWLSWFFRTTSADSEAWERLRVFSGGGWTFCLIERLRMEASEAAQGRMASDKSGIDQSVFRVDAELRGLCEAVCGEGRSR